MLNWIVLNRTDYLHKNGLGVKWPTKVDVIKPNQPIYGSNKTVWKLFVLNRILDSVQL